MPMMPFAPPRLSTITCCPIVSDIFWAMMRPARSLPPPGNDPMTSRTGRTGYACGQASVQNDASASVDKHASPRFTRLPLQSRFQFLHALREGRQHLAVVAHDAQVGAREDLRSGVRVDRDHG